MSEPKGVDPQKSSLIGPGVLLFARFRALPFAVCRIIAVDRKRSRCYVRFEDNTTHWCNFGHIQLRRQAEDGCCLCDLVGLRSDIIACSRCGLGFHRSCHNPVVFDARIIDWKCSVCIYEMAGLEIPIALHRTTQSKKNRVRKGTVQSASGSSSSEHLTVENSSTSVKGSVKKKRSSRCVEEDPPVLKRMKLVEPRPKVKPNKLKTPTLTNVLSSPSSESILCIDDDDTASDTDTVSPDLSDTESSVPSVGGADAGPDPRSGDADFVRFKQRFLNASGCAVSPLLRSEMVAESLQRDDSAVEEEEEDIGKGKNLQDSLQDKLLKNITSLASKEAATRDDGRGTKRGREQETEEDKEGVEPGTERRRLDKRSEREEDKKRNDTEEGKMNEVEKKPRMEKAEKEIVKLCSLPKRPRGRPRILDRKNQLASTSKPLHCKSSESHHTHPATESRNGEISNNHEATTSVGRVSSRSASVDRDKSSKVSSQPPSKSQTVGAPSVDSRRNGKLKQRKKQGRPENPTVGISAAFNGLDVINSLKHPKNVVEKCRIDAARNAEVPLARLKMSVVGYFGSLSRLSNGVGCRVVGCRVSPDGKTEYLVEWDSGIIA